MAESQAETYRLDLRSLDVTVKQVLEDIRLRPTEPELPTGLKQLDSAIWGINRREITCISARTGEGKSALALQIARNLAERTNPRTKRSNRVVFISLEMTKQQLCERLLCQMTKTNSWTLRTGSGRDDFYSKVKPLEPIFVKMNLRMVDGLGFHKRELQHIIDTVIEKAGSPPDAVVVDFIQQVRSEGATPKHEAIGDYIQELKDLCMEHNFAALICSQQNRETERHGERRPTLAGLKGSGSIEELCDCVLLLWWQELGEKDKPAGTKYWILVEKNRHGEPKQMIPVHFDGPTTTFRDAPEAVSGWSGADRAAGEVEV